MEQSSKTETLPIHLSGVSLVGDLTIPKGATGIVVFSHGSGSSRLSPRNRMVAEYLQEQGLGTFLFDLLTPEEDQDYNMRFDIDLLTRRLIETTNWLMQQTQTKELSIGYFGSSTGAASALGAAAEFGSEIKAVVSRGGRPDMAAKVLHLVKSPVLLLVGSHDIPVIGMNQEAYDLLPEVKKMQLIEGATHLFEERGTLEEVSESAANWFKTYLQVKS